MSNYPDSINLTAFSRYLGDDIEDREPRALTQEEVAQIASVALAEQKVAEALHAIRSMVQIDRTPATVDARKTLEGVELDLGGICGQLRDVVKELRAVPEWEIGE